jgi:putative ABC transport system permease protein
MKRNGAGLASICILLTIVLVILSSTSVLFNNSEYCLTVRYPNEIGAFACTYGYDENLTDLGERLDDILYEAAEAHGATVTNNKTYYTYSICGYLENDVLQVTLDSLSDMTFIDYDKVAQIQFIDVGLYNRVFGYNETVEPGKAIVGTANDITLGDTLIIGDSTFEVSKRIDDRIDEIDPASKIAVSPTIYMIVDDVEEVAQNYIQYQDYNGEPMLAWYWYCRFDTGLDVDGQIAVANDLSAILNEELGPLNFTNYYCDSHENQRTDFLSTFGGLMFLGILLSTIFLVSCVLIIYYKQISEGFEDKSRFEIMQKVGMTREDIKKSINSQMLTVFLIPIVFACAHLFMALPIIHKLLMLMGFMNMPMLVATASVCVVICAVFYAAIYKVTSNAYYKIVS